MSIGSFFFLVLVLIFVISGLKRMLEGLAREAEKDQPRKADFEASPSEVQEFLRNLQQARRQQPQAQAPAGGMHAPTRRRMPAAPAMMEGAIFVQEAPAPQAPAVRPVRAPRRRQPDDDTVEELVATEPLKEEPPPTKPVAPELPELKKTGLKEAVLWSEILRPPLSKRRQRGGRRPIEPIGR
jgi:hypothetical protein